RTKVRPATAALSRPAGCVPAGRRENGGRGRVRGPLRTPRLLPPLGQSRGPLAAASVWRERFGIGAAQRCRLQRTAVDQLLAGPGCGRAAGTLLPAGGGLSAARHRPRRAGG